MVKLFKKYTLTLINKTIVPLCNAGGVILDGGSDCLSDIDTNQYVNTFDAILATISIAKHYKEDLHIIRKTSKLFVSEIIGNIPVGLMENIRQILVVLETPQAQIDGFDEDLMLKKYLSKGNQASTSAAGSNNNNRYSEKHFSCLRALLGVQWNEDFFDAFARGLRFIRELMASENNANHPRWNELTQLFKDIRRRVLMPPPPKTNKQLKIFIKTVNSDEESEDSDEDSEDSDSDWDTE